MHNHPHLAGPALRLLTRFALAACGFAVFAGTPALTILTTEEPPTNYLAEGRLTGITTDIIRDLQQRLQDATQIEVQPWSRVYQTALAKPNVLVFTLGRTPERVALGLQFVGPVTTRKHMVYKRADMNLRVDSIADIKREDLIVGGMRADWRTKLMQDAGARVDEETSHDLSIKLLMLGRIQLFVLSDLELKMDADAAGVHLDQIAPAFLISEAPAFFAFSKDSDPALVARWKAAFAEFQHSDAPDRLAKKWGGILGTDMGYTPDKGFFLSK